MSAPTTKLPSTERWAYNEMIVQSRQEMRTTRPLHGETAEQLAVRFYEIRKRHFAEWRDTWHSKMSMRNNFFSIEHSNKQKWIKLAEEVIAKWKGLQ